MDKTKHRFWGNWILNKSYYPCLEYKEQGTLYYQIPLNNKGGWNSGIHNQSGLREWIHQIGGRCNSLDFAKACFELQNEGIIDTPLEWKWELIDISLVKVNPEDTCFDILNPVFRKPGFMVSYLFRLLEICAERKYELAKENYELLHFIWREYKLFNGPKINPITKQIFQVLRDKNEYTRKSIRKLFPNNDRTEIMKAINILVDLKVLMEDNVIVLNRNYNTQCEPIYISELLVRST